MLSGYFKNETATKAAFTPDGWFRTGDLGLIDAQGNVYIKGRMKSMLLSSNGQNIYPEEIESELNNLKYVVESLVVSRQSRLVALVSLDEAQMDEDGADPQHTVEEIRREVNARVPKFSQIAKVEIQKEPFQKTPKQTIKRFLYN